MVILAKCKSCAKHPLFLYNLLLALLVYYILSLCHTRLQMCAIRFCFGLFLLFFGGLNTGRKWHLSSS